MRGGSSSSNHHWMAWPLMLFGHRFAVWHLYRKRTLLLRWAADARIFCSTNTTRSLW
jgi:hypothetical protein